MSFCIAMEQQCKEDDSLFEVGLLFMGGQVALPPYLATKYADGVKNNNGVGSVTSSTAYNAQPTEQRPFYTQGRPTSRWVGNEVVQYWGDDLQPVRRVAQSYIGRDIKKSGYPYCLDIYVMYYQLSATVSVSAISYQYYVLRYCVCTCTCIK